MSRPHLELDERMFRIIRKGLYLVWNDERLMEKALKHVEKTLVGDKRQVWTEIIRERGGRYKRYVDCLYACPCFEGMPLSAKNFWSTYGQDHPFSVVFAPMIREIQLRRRLGWKEAVEEVLKFPE